MAKNHLIGGSPPQSPNPIPHFHSNSPLTSRIHSCLRHSSTVALRFTSLIKRREMKSLAIGLTSPNVLSGNWKLTAVIFENVCSRFFPKNGEVPLKRMKVTTPRAQMSVANWSGSKLIISGAVNDWIDWLEGGIWIAHRQIQVCQSFLECKCLGPIDGKAQNRSILWGVFPFPWA